MGAVQPVVIKLHVVFIVASPSHVIDHYSLWWPCCPACGSSIYQIIIEVWVATVVVIVTPFAPPPKFLSQY